MDHCRNDSVPEDDGGTASACTPRGDSPTTTCGTGEREAVRRSLDERADAVRQRHLARALDSLDADLDHEQRAAVAACSRALVDAVFRCPRRRLRDGTVDPDAVAALFDCDDE